MKLLRYFFIGLFCLFAAFFVLQWLEDESQYGQRGYIVLDLQTGDMDVHYGLLDFQDSYHTALPDDLRRHIQAESLPLTKEQRFITIKPARYHWKPSGSGIDYAPFYYDNFDALGLWLKVRPQVFGERLRQYQQYLITASHDGHLPKFDPIPEYETYIFNDGDKRYDELQKNADAILSDRIDVKRPQD
jgi:hypothetical protein